ncbi:MAG: nitrilase-related carbon-nitrogen hydrolase [Candidatus Kapaibacteriota bacterium]
MKVSAVQFKPLLFEKDANLERMISFIHNTKTDLIVFPELCTTGYFFINKEEIAKYAEDAQGETYQLMQRLSREQNKIIVYGFAEVENGKFYNSAAIVFPDAKYSRIYRKTHLFYKEKFVFTPGNTGFFTIDYPPLDLNLGTLICYDWRFPEAARTLALNGADLIVMPSNLVTDLWHHAMPSRALDNHIYFLVANRIGSEERRNEVLRFNGMSVIFNYNGEVLNLATPSEEVVISSEIDPKESRDKSINAINNIFSDRATQYYFLS